MAHTVSSAFVGNDNVLLVEGLLNSLDGSYLNAATVTATVEDTEGVEVTGETWPVAMPYVSGSDGNYRVVLPSTLGLVAGTTYVAKITANEDTADAYWEFRFKAYTRRGRTDVA